MPYLRSITTGNRVPCTVIKRSWVHRVFLLPSVQVEYIYEGLSGPIYKKRWRYPSEVHDDCVEKLKIVAEALGYKSQVIDSVINPVVVWTGEPLRNWQGFNPANDIKQLIECEDWLLYKGFGLFIDDGCYLWINPQVNIGVYSESRAQAAIDAIVEVIKHD